MFALLFLLAAILEVGGDALIRQFLHTRFPLLALLGCISLISYGFVVNLSNKNFTESLGSYVAAFILVTVIIGHFVFHDKIPPSTFVGLAFIVIGALLIEFFD